MQHLVSKVTVSSANLVTLKLGATTVTWAVNEPERKLAIVTALLKSSPKSIDVRCARHPVTHDVGRPPTRVVPSRWTVDRSEGDRRKGRGAGDGGRVGRV